MQMAIEPCLQAQTGIENGDSEEFPFKMGKTYNIETAKKQ